MSSAPDDGEAMKPLVVRANEAGKPHELKHKVEIRRDDIALVVKVDGLRLTAETCVTCPLGLVSILVDQTSASRSPAIAATDAAQADGFRIRSTSNAAVTS